MKPNHLNNSIIYYPFGSSIGGRTFTSQSYRYGFNGQEKDDEINGGGNSSDYGERMYDTRLGRFMTLDKLARQFAYYSPYQYAGNKPITSIDADGLEEVDYRTVETYDDGSAYIKVSRTENTSATSNGGNLLIHNKNDGKTYTSFEWDELNKLFGIDMTNNYVGDKVNPGGVTGEGSYSFRLMDPSDIISGGTNADGTKNVITFSAIVSKKSTYTPANSIGGSISSVADTPENTRNYLLKTTKELIDPNQSSFGQTPDDVTEINISVGSDEYDNINTDAFTKNLQSSYKNAKINITLSEGSDTGFSVEYKGKEAPLAPKPID